MNACISDCATKSKPRDLFSFKLFKDKIGSQVDNTNHNMSLEQFPDSSSVIDSLIYLLPDDLFPTSCTPDQGTSGPQIVIENLILRTGESLNPQSDYQNDPIEGDSTGVRGPPDTGQPKHTSSEKGDSYGGQDYLNLLEVKQNQLYANFSQQLDQNMTGNSVDPLQNIDEESTHVYQNREPETYDQDTNSSIKESSASESGFSSSCIKSRTCPDANRLKERRREQNRRAARKCREKKKVEQDSVIKELAAIREENAKLKQEVEKLNKQYTELSEDFRSHKTSCHSERPLPESPAELEQ